VGHVRQFISRESWQFLGFRAESWSTAKKSRLAVDSSDDRRKKRLFIPLVDGHGQESKIGVVHVFMSVFYIKKRIIVIVAIIVDVIAIDFIEIPC
jgi:hypothetical protein